MKHITKMLVFAGLFITLSVSAHAATTYTFQFDNDYDLDVDFVGLQAASVRVIFDFEGPGRLNPEDSFSLTVGTAPGLNDLFYLPQFGPSGLDTNTVTFHDVDGLVPISDTFFATFTVLDGVINLQRIDTFFPRDLGGIDAFETFKGTLIRNVSAVPEPATWLMMIIGFALTGLLYRRRIRQNAIGTARNG
ncbi:PEPxxWA-CTERM sorting domain-containing protein [Kordiimonas sp. SCSIO 12610]|uniref:PEPxxWA-CTERM sorting domain-containing protein n=1 Tax=Kordiimonas sp. SCSIO 12610 TaxID=2829597 RepID=UPI00210EE6CD|nr:PEPxxWA-CTERM sorting domain-containing protein [Kordiimonas sp. SCSIO 12610]UTW54366.1 PEP-CTERM sorting domain-containing protein [Kordiimonas sp. SCSIO 12610]